MDGLTEGRIVALLKLRVTSLVQLFHGGITHILDSFLFKGQSGSTPSLKGLFALSELQCHESLFTLEAKIWQYSLKKLCSNFVSQSPAAYRGMFFTLGVFRHQRTAIHSLQFLKKPAFS